MPEHADAELRDFAIAASEGYPKALRALQDLRQRSCWTCKHLNYTDGTWFECHLLETFDVHPDFCCSEWERKEEADDRDQ